PTCHPTQRPYPTRRSSDLGSDYISTNGTVTFAPGVTVQTIVVKVIGELLNETDETFFVNLSNPTNAVLADTQATGTILNDDPLPDRKSTRLNSSHLGISYA